MVKHLPIMWETWVQSLGWEDPPGEGNGNPLQYSWLENPVDGGTWWATVHVVTKSRTWLSNFTFTFKSVVESPWCGGNLQNPHGYNLPADGCLRALHPALSVAASEPGDLLAGGECTTRIRWAVSNVTSASGRQRSLQHFSWPSLHNHPRLQLMWFWKIFLFHSPKYLGGKKRHKIDMAACFFLPRPPGDSALKTYICSLLLFYLQRREFEPMELL